VFIGFAQNNAAHRFMSLNDYYISEYRDAEFVEHVFPLKKKVTDVISVNPFESVNLPTSSSNDGVSVTEPRSSKRREVATNFEPDFVTSFIVESIDNLDVDFITEEFLSNFLIEEDPKTYQEAVKSIDAIF